MLSVASAWIQQHLVWPWQFSHVVCCKCLDTAAFGLALAVFSCCLLQVLGYSNIWFGPGSFLMLSVASAWIQQHLVWPWQFSHVVFPSAWIQQHLVWPCQGQTKCCC